MTVAAVGLAVAVNVAAGGSVGVFVWNTPRLVKRIYVEMVGRRKVVLVEPPICERCGSVMLLRARHLERARLTTTTREGMALLLTCPSCGAEGTILTGADAQFALRRGLTYLNLARGGRQRAEDAARLVQGAGGPHQLIHDGARREPTRRSLPPDRRLALEMAEDERAADEEPGRQWQGAEEIAEIADGMLSSDSRVDEELRRLRERLDSKNKKTKKKEESG